MFVGRSFLSRMGLCTLRRSPGPALFGRQSGLSLLEMLFALALISLMSLILTQSSIRHLATVDRVAQAVTDVTLNEVRLNSISQVLRRSVGAWPEQEALHFVGRADRLSGLTDQPLSGQRGGVVPFQAAFVPDGVDLALVLSVDGTSLTLLRSLTEARFDYRAETGQWFEAWPPERNPGNGFFNDGLFYATPPLPNSIRLRFVKGGRMQVLVIPIDRLGGLPNRPQDIL